MKKNYVMFGLSALALFLCSFLQLTTVKPEMVMVEGGTFKMSPKENAVDVKSKKKIAYDIAVSSFEMSKFEVTVADWRAYVTENKLNMPAKPSWGWNDEYPITNITWSDAVKFCNWLSKTNGLKPAYTKSGGKYVCDFNANGYRLPTDAEWEYAAKGGNKSKNFKYSGSDDIEMIAWYSENSRKSPQKIGTKLANELGLYDMSGNAWEWCYDYYSPIFHKVEKRQNPTGPDRGEKRCIRGGSWDSSKLEYLKPTTNQLNWNPNTTNEFFGFRVVRTVSK
ncbi:SUMF1/EgtB/PvdO family nonheme iron enzyme [Flavobacterium enshiense]|uniref:formylglycine-generating enzyme family protein n=1 Tax=Flavobacterium enshiense TaxID=1341165 RepID=UPI00345C94FF